MQFEGTGQVGADLRVRPPWKQAKRPMDKNLGTQVKRPMDKK
ncbi:MAG: hypothetical protein RBU37_24725 [Myxococcota bacterium]|nr:hypothetical protein [Myxococcota bacterium]